MTQDNTPPGPIFKARLLHINKGVCRPRTGRRWKYLDNSFPRTCRLVLESCLVRSNRALKIRRGGVLSCVIYGTYFGTSRAGKGIYDFIPQCAHSEPVKWWGSPPFFGILSCVCRGGRLSHEKRRGFLRPRQVSFFRGVLEVCTHVKRGYVSRGVLEVCTYVKRGCVHAYHGVPGTRSTTLVFGRFFSVCQPIAFLRDPSEHPRR